MGGGGFIDYPAEGRVVVYKSGLLRFWRRLRKWISCANAFSVGTSTKRLRGYGTCIVMVTSVFTEKIPRSVAECATLGCNRQDVIACATPITTFTVSCAGPSRYISRWMEWGSRRVYLFVFVWVCVPPSPFWPNKQFR